MAKIEMPAKDTTRTRQEKERPKVKPVVSNDKIIRKKKPLSQKIAGKFIAEDVEDVKDYFINDLLIPGIIDTFIDTLLMLLGRGDDYSSSRDRRKKGYHNYNSYSSYKGKSSSSRRNRRSERRRRDEDEDLPEYDNIVIPNRQDAEEIVDRLHSYIDENGDVSIAEFFEMLDLTAPYTDNKWGWTRRSQIDIRKVKGGFLIDVDEAKYLG